MQLAFISLHPHLIQTYLDLGVCRRAQLSESLTIQNINLRDFAVDSRGSVDDRPYGGGDSMVMRPEPLAEAIKACQKQGRFRILLPTPRGQKWNAKLAHDLATSGDNLLFICPRFAGIDQRIIDKYVDIEFSMGEFIVSGGELPALMAADSIVRFLPGALGNETSYLHDSFSEAYEGGLEEDLYTRPEVFEGASVPEVLLGGDHQKIALWREQNRQSKNTKSPSIDKKGSHP